MTKFSEEAPPLIIDAHGITNAVVAGTGSKARKFWTIVLFVMFGIAVVEIVKLVYEFSTHPEMQKVKFVHLSTIKLPDVAVCLKHPWDFKAINASVDLKNFIFKFRLQTNQSNAELVTSAAEFNQIVGYDFEQFYRKYSLTCAQRFMFCRFKSVVFDCCNTTFAKRYLSQLHYVCLNFQSIGNQTDLSMENAFITLVKVKDRKFIEADFDEVPALHDMYEGLPVIFAKEFRELKKSMVIAPPGYATFISIANRKKSYQTKCTLDRPHYFSANGCYYACENIAIIVNCGCRPYAFLDQRRVDYWVDVNQTALCNPVTLKLCMRMMGNNFSTATNACYATKCQFPRLCHAESNDKSVTHGKLDESWMRGILGDEDADLDRYALISVMYDRLGYHLEYDVVIATFDSYVSLLGGQLGLWLGCSVITLIQLIVSGMQFGIKKMSGKLGGHSVKVGGGNTDLSIIETGAGAAPLKAIW